MHQYHHQKQITFIILTKSSKIVGGCDHETDQEQFGTPAAPATATIATAAPAALATTTTAANLAAAPAATATVKATATAVAAAATFQMQQHFQHLPLLIGWPVRQEA